MMSVYGYLIFVILFGIIEGDMYSSIEHLKFLHIQEEIMIEQLKHFKQDLQELFQGLGGRIKSLEEEHNFFSRDIDKYVANPLNSLLLIKRLSYDVELIKTSIEKIVNEFREKTYQYILPISDFFGAVESFHRIQKIYNLKSHDLGNGIIDNARLRKPLTAEELYALGKNMITLDASYSQEYLTLAFEKNKNTQELPNIEILQELLDAYKKSKSFSAAISIVDKMMTLYPDIESLVDEKVDLEVESILESDNELDVNEEDISGTQYSTKKDFIMLSQTCNGNREQNETIKSKLYCFLQSNTAFTLIAPYRVEVMNINPQVLIFHNIVSDNEIDIIKNMTSIRLSRAEVVQSDSTVRVSNIRVSKLTWIYDKAHKVIGRLNVRIEDLSGLNLNSSEMWQIQNYGIGGHYEPHFDFFSPEHHTQMNDGNRIATVLIYLSDVQKGGATVFPFQKLRILPRKGSAVFWYNLNSSGNREYLSLHAACPVLIGSKWVANKWIREHGQEFRKPCELSEKVADDDYKQKYYII